jgi:hypothetical protein
MKENRVRYQSNLQIATYWFKYREDIMYHFENLTRSKDETLMTRKRTRSSELVKEGRKRYVNFILRSLSIC